MFRIVPLLILLGLTACETSGNKHFRTDFDPQEKVLMQRSRALINRSYYATAVTRGRDGVMRARVMEPFPPDSQWTVWLATNDRSRKVRELEQNPQMTLHYFDRSSPGYVSLYGKAYLVRDPASLQRIWRPGWERFYPGRKHYLLIRFEPEFLEMVDVGNHLPGDSLTWQPYRLILRE